MESWDYIIVGGGSAGCVLANRLSADPSRRILLLDAGRPANRLINHVPAGQMPMFSRADMNWLYMAEPDPSLNGRVLMWPAGKVIGGGSAINGMMFVRGHPCDYDAWAANGCEGWDYQSLLPLLRRMENWEGGADTWRGGDGPQAVSRVRIEHPLTDAFVEAAVNAGIAFNEDLNGELAEGVGYCQATQRNGLRASSASAYLSPVTHRPNLRVEHHALVERVLLEGRRVTGVSWRRGGSTHTTKAERGVILSAGAIATPKLLMLSGIGPEQELRRHGITVNHALEGVGRNLQEHAVGSVGVKLRGIDTLTSELGILSAIRHGLDYLLRRRGALSTSIGHAQALIRTHDAAAAPDAQIIFAPLAYELTPKGPRPARERVVGVGVGLCHTHSLGEIRLRSAELIDPPVIDYRLLGSSEDMKTLIAACRIAREILHTQPFAEYVEAENEPGAGVSSDAEWESYLRETTGLMYHPCGTCRMGNDADAVVDPQLRLRGFQGAWIADASVIPSIPAGNINATCILIGEKAAELISD